MTSPRLSLLGKRIALFSLLGGTLLISIYYVTTHWMLLFVGYAYILITGIVNLTVFIQLLIRSYNDKDNRNKTLITCGLMLLNLPVLIIYCWFATIIVNTMRITFINTMETELTEININGCQHKHIDKLAPGESKTEWIDIPNDCAIGIEYYSNGIRKSEEVSGYCTFNMGQKATYRIGKDKSIFDNL